MTWTPERIETLKALWAEGLSGTQVARQMGDVTRSAVLGAVWRYGLPPRAPDAEGVIPVVRDRKPPKLKPMVYIPKQPPIPIREFDWCAYFDGQEESANYGWGSTEAAAIKDLKQCYGDEE